MKKHILAALVTVLFVLPLAASALSSDEALKLLKDGNARYAAQSHQAEKRAATAAQQKPIAAVLACADSRVPVETIFDHGLGDIFVVRVAGNIATDSSVIGSLEYAIGNLHVPLLVILGHSRCGAVKAAVDQAKVSGALADIENSILPVVCRTRATHPELKGDAFFKQVIADNTIQAEADLLAKSPALCRLARAHRYRIVTAVYDIETGGIAWLN